MREFRNAGIVAGVLFLLLAHAGAGGDFWRSSADAGVATNNDCGSVAHVVGGPVLHRSFMGPGERGLPLHIADRVYSGDEIAVPAGSLLELHSGDNAAVVVGPGTRARMDGLRAFPLGDGRNGTRLDITVLQGEIRIQVRLNEGRPEAVLAAIADAEFLVTRGDAVVSGGENWRAVVVSGDASARMVRGSTRGAVFAIDGALGGAGQDAATPEELAVLRVRLPFSFESIRAALPPLPAASRYLEAP